MSAKTVNLSQAKKSKFHALIFTWWDSNRRDLPWRKTHDPYKILVSEIMLQQTQVARVILKYQEFISTYPHVLSLSQAPVSDIIRLWKGLGYNRRALYLKKTADIVSNLYGGVFPKDEQLLTKLPGLGRYTARAILVFAYKQQVGMVDTNIRQIITHFFFKDASQKEKVIQEFADALVPKGKSWQWHQALMDYGALELPKIRRPKVQKKKTISFRDSNRFYRGRIIDALRDHEWDAGELVKHISYRYGKSDTMVENIVESLVKDGLITRLGKKINLPD